MPVCNVVKRTTFFKCTDHECHLMASSQHVWCFKSQMTSAAKSEIYAVTKCEKATCFRSLHGTMYLDAPHCAKSQLTVCRFHSSFENSIWPLCMDRGCHLMAHENLSVQFKRQMTIVALYQIHAGTIYFHRIVPCLFATVGFFPHGWLTMAHGKYWGHWWSIDFGIYHYPRANSFTSKVHGPVGVPHHCIVW